jgi:hypothetical protein
MQATGVLCHRASPRHWKRQKQRVKARVIEALTHVLARRQYHPTFIGGDHCQSIGHGLSPLPSRSCTQDDEVGDTRHEQLLEAVEVIVTLRQHEGRPAAVHGVDHVIRDPTSARHVVEELPIECLELHAPVGIRPPTRVEPGRLDQDEVLERP